MPHSLYDIAPLEALLSQGYILLTPNYRLARRIKAEWDSRRAAAGDTAWVQPAVYPVESWLLAQWDEAVRLDLVEPLTPLSAAQERETWRQVIRTRESQSDDYHLLRPATTAEIASQARDTLQRWQVDTAEHATRQLFEFDPDCATFLDWLGLFDQRLAAAGQVSAVDCLAQLAGVAGLLSRSRVALIECGEIPPLLRSALEALCTEVLQLPAGDAMGQKLLHPFADKRVELEGAAAWAAKIYRQQPGATVGIVLSDMASDRVPLEYLLRREFDCLGDNYNSLPVNFSTGIALSDAPVVRDALAVLGLGMKQVAVPSVAALLHSRFLDLPDAGSPLAHNLVSRLYDDGREMIDVADLRYDASQMTRGGQQGLVLGQHMAAMFRLPELKRAGLPSQWSERFSQVLSLWGWPGIGSLDSLEYQQVELWYATLDEFRAYDAVCPALDFSEALGLLRDTCSRKVSQPQTVDSNVQVLGPLEAAGLSFDQLWVCGMQAGSWPAPARPNPFIPLSLQSRLQMPHATAEREWAYGEALVEQYERNTRFLHASYCRQLDGIPDLPSPLLANFAASDWPAAPLIPDHWASHSALGQLEPFEDSKAPSLDLCRQSDISGGSGLLEDQSQCPFRAFARRRLRVQPLSEFTVALSAADRGTLLHNALFALWGEIVDQSTLLTLDEQAEGEVVERSVRAAIDSASPRLRRGLGAAYWRLEGQRLITLLHEWLAVERERNSFVVLAREEELTLELCQLEIRLRVDRIDELADGERVIIDYKSGSSSVQHWLGERPQKPQLLLYGIAAPDSTAALAFAQVRPRDCCYVGLGEVAAAKGIITDIPKALKSKMDAQDWSTLNERWRENLQRIAQSFVDGEAQVDPLSPASCTWCGLQALCRIALVGSMEEGAGT